MLIQNTTSLIRAATDGRFAHADHSPSWDDTDRVEGRSGKPLNKRAKNHLKSQRRALAKTQEQLYADDRFSLLILVQGMDGAGKDSTIKQVMSGVNPQGCQVFSFKQPSAKELDHNFLWRYWQGLPERGRIGIFNRSYYEDVLVVRVHPERMQRQRLPAAPNGSDFWDARFEDINAFERHMTRNGTVILKFFLNVSKEEQRRRFIRRLTMPDKLWKFSLNDLNDRAHWDAYQHAYEELIAATSTDWAPWYVIPADSNWLMRALVSHVVVEAIEGLGVRFPKMPPGRKTECRQALKALRAEDAGQDKGKTAPTNHGNDR